MIRHQRPRGRQLRDAVRLLVLLRRGRWTMPEIADELGVGWRTAYRIVRALEDAGVTVEVSREEGGARGMAPGHYTVPAAPLRRMLRL